MGGYQWRQDPKTSSQTYDAYHEGPPKIKLPLLWTSAAKTVDSSTAYRGLRSSLTNTYFGFLTTHAVEACAVNTTNLI